MSDHLTTEALLNRERLIKFQVGYPVIIERPRIMPLAPNSFCGWECEVTDEADGYLVVWRSEEPEYVIR